jgi:hypothetical protein
MPLIDLILLHGGEALWILFIPGAVVAVLLCVGGAALTLRGLDAIGGRRLSINANESDRREGSDLDGWPLPDDPASEKGRSQFRIGIVLLSLAVLFLGWCRHIGFLSF